MADLKPHDTIFADTSGNKPVVLEIAGGKTGETLSQLYQSIIHARIVSAINMPTTRNTG